MIDLDCFQHPARVEFHAERSVAEQRLRLYAIANDPSDGKRSVMLPGTFRNIEDGSMIEPTLRLTHVDAQNLIDELWNAGVRPTNVGSAGQLAAVEKHLDDMQAIAVGLLRRDGVDL